MTIRSDEAAALLERADRLDSAVHRQARRAPAAFLIGLGVSTLGYFATLGFTREDPAVLAASAVFVAAVVGQVLANFVGGLPVTRRGFARRWVAAMGGWAVVYSLGMGFGMTLFRAEPLFWIPAGLLALVPCVLGAVRELRR